MQAITIHNDELFCAGKTSGVGVFDAGTGREKRRFRRDIMPLCVCYVGRPIWSLLAFGIDPYQALHRLDVESGKDETKPVDAPYGVTGICAGPIDDVVHAFVAARNYIHVIDFAGKKSTFEGKGRWRTQDVAAHGNALYVTSDQTNHGDVVIGLDPFSFKETRRSREFRGADMLSVVFHGDAVVVGREDDFLVCSSRTLELRSNFSVDGYCGGAIAGSDEGLIVSLDARGSAVSSGSRLAVVDPLSGRLLRQLELH